MDCYKVLDARPFFYMSSAEKFGFITLFNSDFGLTWSNQLKFSCRIGIKKYVKLFGLYFTFI